MLARAFGREGSGFYDRAPLIPARVDGKCVTPLRIEELVIHPRNLVAALCCAKTQTYNVSKAIVNHSQ